MFKEFYEWYIKEISTNPLITVAGSLVALFAAIGSIYNGFQITKRLFSFFSNKFFGKYILYRKLKEIQTGLNIKFVESIIGVPVTIRMLPREYSLDSFSERIYEHQWYFLRVIVDKENNVVFYSITVRDLIFNPYIPLTLYQGDIKRPYVGNMQLGKMSLADMKDYSPEDFNVDTWGMSAGPYYNERYYFGNPGNYKDYFFEFSSSGCGLSTNSQSDAIDVIVRLWNNRGKNLQKNLSSLCDYEKLRKLKPNTFGILGVVNRSDVENEKKLSSYLLKEGVGPNYYDIREF